MKKKSKGIPIRYKLTLWYIVLFSVSIIGYEAYSDFELKASLFGQIDAALAAESDRAVQDLDVEKGILVFQNKENMPAKAPAARVTAFKMRIVEASGKIVDARNDFPAIIAHLAAGYQTLSLGSARYRVLTTEIPMAGLQEKSFMQVADSLAMVDDELASALTRLLVGLPLILIIAAAGGLLLANAALRPIVDMTGLAEAMSEDKLSERLKYRGPDDEIGKLAATFDSMLDRLEASFLREKRFTADASHELKTPLTAIKGKLEVALSQSRSAKEYEAALSGLKGDVERMIALSSDLLFLARMGKSGIASRMEEVDLSMLLDICVDQTLSAAGAGRVIMRRDFSDAPRTRGASEYLVRLFLNILDNAVKYSDFGGIIEVRTRVETGKAIVEIQDSGPGIPASELPLVFRPFYRVEDDRSRARGGAGLGLAIAHEIAEAHGGSIVIDSQVGKGTTVRISLPLLSRGHLQASVSL